MKKIKETQQKAEVAEGIYIKNYIETLQELSLECSGVKEKLMSKFAFTEEQAEEKMKLYWKELD